MDEKNFKEKIDIAKKAVEGQAEPYKTEAFKIILSKLLNSDSKYPSGDSAGLPSDEGADVDNDNPLQKFANEIGINKNDLMNVIDFTNNELSLLRVKGEGTKEQNFYSAIIILAFWKVVCKDEPFISNVKFSPISKYGIPTNHLSKNLKQKEYKEFIITKGKKKAIKYRITTKGIQKAYEIIRELAQ